MTNFWQTKADKSKFQAKFPNRTSSTVSQVCVCGRGGVRESNKIDSEIKTGKTTKRGNLIVQFDSYFKPNEKKRPQTPKFLTDDIITPPTRVL